MPILRNILTIDPTASGGTFTLPSTDMIDEYTIVGTYTMIGDIFIVPSGTYSPGMTYIFKWNAVLDITTHGTSVTIFGASLNEDQVQKLQTIECIYNGTSWDIQLYSNFFDTSILDGSSISDRSIDHLKIMSNTLTDSEIDASGISRIADDAISTIKIQDDAVTSDKILNAAITETKIHDDAVTTDKILDSAVTTDKINDQAVNNDKLSLMSNHSLKYGDATGNPGDLVLNNNKIPIGDGTTITTIDKSVLLNGTGTYTSLNLDLSFEADSINGIKFIYLPFDCTIVESRVSVITDIESTDDATISIDDLSTSTTIATIVVPAGYTPPNVVNTTISYTYSLLSPTSKIGFSTMKTTPGGRVQITLLLQKL